MNSVLLFITVMGLLDSSFCLDQLLQASSELTQKLTKLEQQLCSVGFVEQLVILVAQGGRVGTNFITRTLNQFPYIRFQGELMAHKKYTTLHSASCESIKAAKFKRAAIAGWKYGGVNITVSRKQFWFRLAHLQEQLPSLKIKLLLAYREDELARLLSVIRARYFQCWVSGFDIINTCPENRSQTFHINADDMKTLKERTVNWHELGTMQQEIRFSESRAIALGIPYLLLRYEDIEEYGPRTFICRILAFLRPETDVLQCLESSESTPHTRRVSTPARSYKELARLIPEWNDVCQILNDSFKNVANLPRLALEGCPQARKRLQESFSLHDPSMMETE